MSEWKDFFVGYVLDRKKSRGVSHAEIHRELGLSRDVYSNFFYRSNKPSFDVLMRMVNSSEDYRNSFISWITKENDEDPK